MYRIYMNYNGLSAIIGIVARPQAIVCFGQESLDNLLVKKGWYGDREDFTVVLQETPLVTDLAPTAVSL